MTTETKTEYGMGYNGVWSEFCTAWKTLLIFKLIIIVNLWQLQNVRDFLSSFDIQWLFKKNNKRTMFRHLMEISYTRRTRANVNDRCKAKKNISKSKWNVNLSDVIIKCCYEMVHAHQIHFGVGIYELLLFQKCFSVFWKHRALKMLAIKTKFEGKNSDWKPTKEKCNSLKHLVSIKLDILFLALTRWHRSN